MIILLYLIVIFGWALLILVIKCRKAREKRIALAQQEGMQTFFPQPFFPIYHFSFSNHTNYVKYFTIYFFLDFS